MRRQLEAGDTFFDLADFDKVKSYRLPKTSKFTDFKDMVRTLLRLRAAGGAGADVVAVALHPASGRTLRGCMPLAAAALIMWRD